MLRRRNFLMLALLTAALLILPLRAADLPYAAPEKLGLSTERLARLDTVINDYIAKERVAGTVTLILRNGKIAYYKAQGMKDRENSAAMPKDAIFRICSMTKPITSVAIMLLYEEGRFMLSDPVSKFIPEFKNPKILKKAPNGETYTVPADNEITIRHLLTHTSGLTYHWNPELGALYKENEIGNGVRKETLSLSESIKRLARLPILFNPGERFEYSLSIDALGYLVEVVSGMSLDEFFRTRIFKPLDMADTYFFLPESKQDRLATAYTWYKEQGLKRFPDEPIVEGNFSYDADYPYKGKKLYQSGGGGLCSTAMDYAKFCQMLLNGGTLNGMRLLSPKTVEMMTAEQVSTGDPASDFGLGFGIQAKLTEMGSEGRYGWGGFYNTRFFIDPQEKYIGILMSQLHPTGDMQMLDQFEVLSYQAIVQ